jgi:23S rRNA (guanosine2251-2'-O)-methyltransferase
MEVIIGKNPVREALLFSSRLQEVFLVKEKKKTLREIAFLAETKKVKLSWLGKEDFYKKFPYPSTQGVAAFARPFPYLSLDEFFKKIEGSKRVTLVVLDGVEDPQNFGSLLRSTECLGGDGVVVRERRSVKVTPTVYKVSAGAAERVSVIRVKNITRALRDLKTAGFWIYGAEASSGKTVWEVEPGPKLALVLGSEGRGLSRLVKEECDELVSIPLRGRIGSLNVAVAGAILLYEILRRYETQNSG